VKSCPRRSNTAKAEGDQPSGEKIQSEELKRGHEARPIGNSKKALTKRGLTPKDKTHAPFQAAGSSRIQHRNKGKKTRAI